MATKTFPTAAAVEAATVALTPAQMATASVAPEGNDYVLTYPNEIAALIGAGPTAAQISAYAEAKQTAVLEALVVSHPLKDGAATLDTRCGASSMLFLNSLAAWAIMAASSASRTYYNLDGSAHQVSPADMTEFLSAVGAAVQSTFDVLATVLTDVAASPPTVKSFADVDGAAWPTSAS